MRRFATTWSARSGRWRTPGIDDAWEWTSPSALPGISPTRGEIGQKRALCLNCYVNDGRNIAPSNLPPCGGDVRQDRGGYLARERTKNPAAQGTLPGGGQRGWPGYSAGWVVAGAVPVVVDEVVALSTGALAWRSATCCALVLNSGAACRLSAVSVVVSLTSSEYGD